MVNSLMLVPGSTSRANDQKLLGFILLLSDPTYSLSCCRLESQSSPSLHLHFLSFLEVQFSVLYVQHVFRGMLVLEGEEQYEWAGGIAFFPALHV